MVLYFVLPPKSVKMYGHAIRTIHGTTLHNYKLDSTTPHIALAIHATTFHNYFP